MKLYAWKPRGHGEQSFFVAAESEGEARAAVDEEIQRLLNLSSCDEDYWGDVYTHADFNGWGTDYYVLTVVEPGIVLRNDNS